MHTLPLTRLTFTVRFNDTYAKPKYAGSALRGSFGRALKRTVCVTRQPECDQCPVRTSCVYPKLFSPRILHPQGSPPPAPYIVRDLHWGPVTLSPGETWRFSQTLLGDDALNQAALLLYVWQRALSQGLGKYRAKGEIIRVEDPTGQPVYTPENGTLSPPARFSLPQKPEKSVSSMKLKLITPWRYYEKEHLIKPDSFQPAHFFRSLYYRLREVNQSLLDQKLLLNENTLPMLERIPLHADLHWTYLKRHSSRQKAFIPLSGMMGTLILNNVPPEAQQLIRLAQWIHIGKNTTFGLGAIQISENS